MVRLVPTGHEGCTSSPDRVPSCCHRIMCRGAGDGLAWWVATGGVVGGDALPGASDGLPGASDGLSCRRRAVIRCGSYRAQARRSAPRATELPGGSVTEQRHDAAPAGLDQRLERLLEAVLTVASDLDLESMLGRIVQAACELVDARYGALGVIDEEGTALAAFVHHGMAPEVVRDIGHLPEGHGVLGLLISRPETIRLEDLGSHPDAYGFPPGHPPMRSFVGVPIRIGDQAYGNLYLTEKRGAAAFSAEDEELLVGLAAVAGAAIANARLYADAQRRERWREAIGEVASAVLDGESPQLVRQRVAAGAAELLDAQGACLLEPHDEGLWVLAAVGQAPIEGFLDLPDAPMLPTLERGEPLRLDHGPVFGRAAVWAPVTVAGKVEAAIGVGRDELFTTKELEALVSFASQVNVAWSFERAQAQVQHLSLIADRERIGRDLHDTVIQRLFATGLSLQATQRRLADQPDISERLERAVDDIDSTVREIRATIFALQSAGAAERGVRAQVLEVVEELADVLPRAPRVRFDGPIDTVVGVEVCEQLLPVVREALTNVAKHAAATDIELELAADHAGVRLRVADDGRGMGPRPGRGLGLENLRERAEVLGGSFAVSSPGSDRGTVVIWTVPGR
jgi:signal transduction histidine kinase